MSIFSFIKKSNGNAKTRNQGCLSQPSKRSTLAPNATSLIVSKSSDPSYKYNLLEALALPPDFSRNLHGNSDSTLKDANSSAPTRPTRSIEATDTQPRVPQKALPRKTTRSTAKKSSILSPSLHHKTKSPVFTFKRSQKRPRNTSSFLCAHCKANTFYILSCEEGHSFCKDCLFIKVFNSSKGQSIPCSLFNPCSAWFDYSAVYSFCFGVDVTGSARSSIDLNSSKETLDFYEFISSEPRTVNIQITTGPEKVNQAQPDTISLSFFSLNDTVPKSDDDVFPNVFKGGVHECDVHSNKQTLTTGPLLCSSCRVNLVDDNNSALYSNKLSFPRISEISTLTLSKLNDLSEKRSLSLDIHSERSGRQTSESINVDRSLLETISMFSSLNVSSLYPLLNSCTDDIQRKTLSAILASLRIRSQSTDSNASHYINSISYSNFLSYKENSALSYKTPLKEIFKANAPAPIKKAHTITYSSPYHNREILVQNLNHINLKLQKLKRYSKSTALIFDPAKNEIIYNTIKSNNIIRKKASRGFKTINVSTKLTFSTEELLSYEKLTRNSIVSEKSQHRNSKTPPGRTKKIALVDSNNSSEAKITDYSIVLKKKHSDTDKTTINADDLQTVSDIKPLKNKLKKHQ